LKSPVKKISAGSPLKIEIPGKKNLGRQRCAEGFNSGGKWLDITMLQTAYKSDCSVAVGV
jgi:hypothetical protein